MTTAEKNARAVVEAWCRKEKIRLTCRPCHVHPRAYVVGYAAPGWSDCGAAVAGFRAASPRLRSTQSINRDSSLRSDVAGGRLVLHGVCVPCRMPGERGGECAG